MVTAFADYESKSKSKSKFIKLVAEHLASPLTHIKNTYVRRQEFPLLWKLARISPIPEVDGPQVNGDYRPVSILPALSKIFEKLMRKMVELLSENATLHPTEHYKCLLQAPDSATTTMLAIRVDILKAMKRCEITVAVMADFSKAFDTVAYETVFFNLYQMGFSNNSLWWITSYLTDRSQYVRIDAPPLPLMIIHPSASV